MSLQTRNILLSTLSTQHSPSSHLPRGKTTDCRSKGEGLAVMTTTEDEPHVLLKEEACNDPPPVPDDDAHGEDSYTVETIGAFLSEAESLKNRGNIEFQKGRVLAKHTAGKNLISDACLLYAEGLRALASVDEGLAKLMGQEVEGVAVESDQPTSPQAQQDLETIPATFSALSDRADSIRPTLYLNLAACNLLLNEKAAAIACCTHVLEQCGGGIAAAVAFAEKDGGGGGELSDSLLPVEGRENDTDGNRCRELAAKALYRRSAAREGVGDYVAAREDLVRALRLKPGDASIRRELKKVSKKVADAEASEALRRETEEGRIRHQRQQQQQQQRQQQQQQHRGGQGSAPNSPPGAIPLEAQPESTIAAAATGEGDAEKPSAGPNFSAPPADHAVAHSSETVDSHDTIDGKEGDGRKGPLDQEAKREGQQPGDDEEQFPTGNGGECREGLYRWNQSVQEVQVCVKVPAWAGANDLRVDIHRLRLSVAVLSRNRLENLTSRGSDPNAAHEEPNGGGPSPTPASATKGELGVATPAAASRDESMSVLAGELARPVQVDECLWTMERRGSVVLYLQKELPAEGEPGFEWWANVMEGDPEIDTLKCDAGSIGSKYPEHVRRRKAKAEWDDQQKSPEERLNEQRMRDAKRQMVEEAEERQRNLENALKDPNKAKLYRQLKETMPDVPISMK